MLLSHFLSVPGDIPHLSSSILVPMQALWKETHSGTALETPSWASRPKRRKTVMNPNPSCSAPARCCCTGRTCEILPANHKQDVMSVCVLADDIPAAVAPRDHRCSDDHLRLCGYCCCSWRDNVTGRSTLSQWQSSEIIPGINSPCCHTLTERWPGGDYERLWQRWDVHRDANTKARVCRIPCDWAFFFARVRVRSSSRRVNLTMCAWWSLASVTSTPTTSLRTRSTR